MMGQVQKLRQAKQELENPHESERIRAVAEMLAEMQRAMRAGVMDQRDALHIDPGDGAERIDHEERTEDLLDVADGYLPGGPPLAEIWLERAAPEELDVQDPAALASYAGLSGEEWEHQIQSWADSYRAQSDDADSLPRRELADLHVSAKWGVSLDRFEALVVEFDRGTALRDLLAGPSEITEDALRNNTEAQA